jgi:5-methylcytosine-specific restriction endonuclease McrA
MREPVKITARKAFTPKQRLEVLLACKGRCAICREKITGPFEVEHRVPLALGGTNDPSNLEAVHPTPCHALKTLADVKAIAKARRLAGETCAGPTKRPLKSRGFDKTRSRKFNGSVVKREERA